MSEHEILVPEAEFEPRADLDRLQSRAWIVGGIGAALTAAGYLSSQPDFLRAYLVAWIFCLATALGVFGVTMLHHVTGGDWGILMRRLSEASGRTLPFFVIAALPIVFHLGDIYKWVNPAVDETGHIVDHLLAHKEPYLNTTAFLVRGAIYFAIWTALAYLLSGWSRKHDETGDPTYLEKMKRLSALGIVLHVLTCTLASVDWMMSLDPHWFSSLFGVAFVAGQILAAMAFAVIAMLFLSSHGRKPFTDLVRTKAFHDYGKLMTAFVMFWGYMMISQYLIIWSGNLPEEITWYIERSAHGWKLISFLLVIGHFALPFALLLSADLKKRAKLLAMVAVWVLVMRWFDFYWQVAPSLGHHQGKEGVFFSWIEPVAVIGLGGLWLGLLIATLKKRAVVPSRLPELKEILAHG